MHYCYNLMLLKQIIHDKRKQLLRYFANLNCNTTGTLTQYKSSAMCKAKLVSLSFELKYLTPKIGPCVKLKLLKSYTSYKFNTLDKKEILKK